MFTPADLIEALQRRQRWSLRPRYAPGEFPPGWRAWFDALRERMGTIRGATADAIVALLVQRELRRAPPRMPALNDWQAFTTLWRQQWQPASADERGQRIAAMAISLLAQLGFAVFFLWLAYARYGGPPRELSEDGFVLELEQGYETQLGERGTRLSLGQRQLIAFARALLADPRILILDEATSNIDRPTEILIEQAFDTLGIEMPGTYDILNAVWLEALVPSRSRTKKPARKAPMRYRR